ncbi:Uncharacterised protein [uncultured archaeon]|nr:Uncharacterised protein [uncultured archaeon]
MASLSGQSIICDSSALISLTDSCFVHVFYFLKKKFRGKFIIPRSVEYECVDHPMQMKMHALHALRLKRAIKDSIIEVVDIPLQKRAEEIQWAANNSFYARGTPIQLLHAGETEMLALAQQLDVENLLIDERTTRMLSEDPDSLREHLEHEFGCTITVDQRNLAAFSNLTKNMRFFRSSEFLLLAYEKGYFEEYGDLEKDAVEASLYKLKYGGCSVGFSEIGEYVAHHIKA